MNIASGYPLSDSDKGPVKEVEQDPKNLTASLLKLCNITRPKHLKVNQVHRSTGRGGAGPYGSKVLSPVSSKNTPNIFSNFGSSTFYNQGPPPTSHGVLSKYVNSSTLLSPKSMTVME